MLLLIINQNEKRVIEINQINKPKRVRRKIEKKRTKKRRTYEQIVEDQSQVSD